MNKLYQVIQYADYLDPNPVVSDVVEFYEAENIYSEWLEKTVSFVVEHSPYRISSSDLIEIEEAERELIRIVEVQA
jgi:hypothetical protein